MSLPELSINRHVLAYMLSGVIALFGVISYLNMGVDRYPDVDIPIVSVTTVQAGANPSVIDASITNIIEREINSVPGIDYIRSSSTAGVSGVTIAFDLDKDINVAFNEVQAKVNQVLDRIPEDADPPVVAKIETDAQPIMWVALRGDRTQQQLNVYADNVLRKQLENISGVGEVRIGGQRDRTIRVELDIERLPAFGITVQDVLQSFRDEHLLLPGGFLVADATESLIKLDLEYHSPDQLEELVVGYRDGAAILLRDIAQVQDALSDYRQVARFNGEPTVGLGIVKVSGTNTVAIIEAVKEAMQQELIPELPPGLTLSVSSDTSTFILEMVHALQEHIVLGSLLAGFIVWVFLRNFRSTLIIAIAVPVSLLGAIGAMYAFGYTFNSITLLALLLLVGVVVDDAIVVLENIYRHREEIDPDPKTAAINGTREVMFAVLAATLSLVAIFAPVLFMEGMVGRFLESFGVVVVFGVVVSWFVALTLTPMLCSRYLRVEQHDSWIYKRMQGAFESLERGYSQVLNASLHLRWLVVVVTVLLVGASSFFFIDIGKEFSPTEDEGQFMVLVKTPLGSNIDYTDARLKEVEAILAAEPAVQNFFTAVGLGQQGQVNQALGFVRMMPRHERDISQQALVRQLQGHFAQIPGAQVFATEVPGLGGGRGEPLQFAVTGRNLDRVADASEQLLARLSDVPGIGRLDLDLQLNMPQLRLDVDRIRARSLGLSTREVAQAANVLAGGVDVARYNDEPGDGERYDIRLKARSGSFDDPADLSRIFLRAADGSLVRLDTVARFESELGPSRIDRFDLQYAAMFYGDPTLPLGEAMQAVNTAATEILPIGYNIKLLGSAREFERTMNYIVFAFVMAVLLLYMVLASQFDSFLQPLIIMVAQPLAMIGGLAALWAAGHTLNIYSMIGMILLVGLVAKNSILLVDLTNQYRERGMPISQALREACPVRLRPVLMTSFTVILALVPAATGVGAGSDRNGPLSVAVIGGMVTSTLLTLVVVPVAYALLEGGAERWRARRHQRHTPAASGPRSS